MPHKKRRIGKITFSGRNIPEPHELKTAKALASKGKDVEFIRPSRVQHTRTPDIIMDGIMWEMKCPMGKNKKNIANIFHRALKQSKNIIIDIRQIEIDEKEALVEIKRNAAMAKSLKKLKVVGGRNVIDIK